MMRVGLVLGGGGTFGLAYHVGALAALANDCRWDPRDADVIVGTSAGAIVGGLLRRGVPAHDLAASMVGVELLETPASLAAQLAERPDPPRVGWRHIARLPRVSGLPTIVRALVPPWKLDPMIALTSVLPHGRSDLIEHVPVLREWASEEWPDAALWIVATDYRRLTRVVFGRAARPKATLRDAIAASCAVPGYFAPVEIEDRLFVDGGVASPTNADVLARSGLDLDVVVIIAPLGWHGSAPPLVQRPWRDYAARRVRRERDVLSRQVPTIVIAPGAEVTGPFGHALMSAEQLRELTHAAFLDTGQQLTRTDLPALLSTA